MNTSGEKPSQEVIDLDRAYFPHPWTEAEWGKFDLGNLLYVLRKEGKVIGFALFGISDDTAHLYKILLVPTERGAGQAQSFWKDIIQDLKKKNFAQVYLEVAAQNLSALAFYRKVGMQELRIIKSYYSNGEDAVTMNLTL